MKDRFTASAQPLRIALGLTATLAGLDKFFNILADWGAYVSPAAARLLPFSVDVLMRAVGVVELGVGIAILAVAPRVGAYIASAWLLLVAPNLAIGGFFDVAVRDVVMSIAAFTVAQLLEAPEATTAAAPHVATPRRTVTA